MNLKKIGVLFIYLILTYSASCQEPYAQHLSIINGLPSNSVYSILEDDNGFIWFTCNEGLYRYDGTYYKSYREKNQISFPGSGITKDVKGRIWYQNFDGHSYYVQNGILHELTQKTISSFSPVRTTKSHVFIQESGSIVAFDMETLKPIKSFKTNKFVFSSTVFNNQFYFIDGQILFKINEELQIERIGRVPIEEVDYPFLEGNQKNLYLTKKKGNHNAIYKLVNQDFVKIVDLDNEIIIQNIRIIRDNLYLLTSSGFYQYDLKTNKIINAAFHTKNITDLLFDRKGNLWITTILDGIRIAPDLKVKQYEFDFLQPIRSINYGKKLLISSKNEKLFWFEPEKISFTEFSSGNSNALPYYTYIDSLRQEVVRVQSDGYTYFSDLSTKKLSEKIILAIKRIIPFDHKYNAFVSSGFMGFYCHKNDLNKKSEFDAYILKLEQRIHGNYIFFRLPIEGRATSVYCDNLDKKLYFITNLGTYIWKNGNLSSCLSDYYLNEMFSWNGYLFGVGKDEKIKILKHPVENTVDQITLLKEIENIKQVKQTANKLFIRTSSKIVIYENKENKIQLYSSFNLQYVECNGFSVIDQDVWILTSNGFILWNLNQNRKQYKSGKFQLNRVRFNGKRIENLSNISLNYKQNNLIIDFSLIDFGISTISDLEYKINDQPWVNIDPEYRSLAFPALASGKYNIQIRGKINDEIQNFETLNFQINPPFWSTVWFVFICFTIISVLIIWYYNKKIIDNRLRNQLINEKITLESNLNKSLLASIKSQMNPHFIFNALNTIQAYIYMNDKENASRYLSKFSKLTRSVLEMSEKEEIYLSEDLVTLTLYLDLEKMRFQDGFEYVIETPDFDPSSVKIPSMLLQPYVENAIKHGLMHSDNDKKLSILIHKDQNALTVVIEDNGIGRKRAGQLKIQRDKYQEGFSSQANEKRLNLLNDKNEISVIYTDKYDENGQPTGTTVQLKIQLKK